MATESVAAPRGCTNLKLRQASRLVTRHYEAYVAPTGLKNTQYSLLSYVVKLGPIRAGDLAAAMQLDASTLTRNLQPLVLQGWVQVTTGDDARSRIVEATDAGRPLRVLAQRAGLEAGASGAQRAPGRGPCGGLARVDRRMCCAARRRGGRR